MNYSFFFPQPPQGASQVSFFRSVKSPFRGFRAESCYMRIVN